MKLVKTLHLGHNNTDDVATIDRSHPIRFSHATMYSWGTVVALLSKPFNKAQLLYQEGSLDKPYHVAVTYPYDLDFKRKKSDAEPIFDRFVWIVDNMRIPPCGMTVSFYHAPKTVCHVVEPWALNEFWTMKEQNKPKGEYITMQKLEKGIGGSKKSWTYNEVPKYMKKVEEWAHDIGVEIKYIDYTMPYQEMYETLLGSDAHFTYCGSTYYFAAMINLKTYGLAPYFNKNTVRYSYHDYLTGDLLYSDTEKSYWGAVGVNRARITQYDHEQNVTLNAPPSYLHHMHELSTLQLELSKLKRNFM